MTIRKQLKRMRKAGERISVSSGFLRGYTMPMSASEMREAQRIASETTSRSIRVALGNETKRTKRWRGL